MHRIQWREQKASEPSRRADLSQSPSFSSLPCYPCPLSPLLLLLHRFTHGTPTREFGPDLPHHVIVQHVQHELVLLVVDGVGGDRVRAGQAFLRVVVVAELLCVTTDAAIVVALSPVTIASAASATVLALALGAKTEVALRDLERQIDPVLIGRNFVSASKYKNGAYVSGKKSATIRLITSCADRAIVCSVMPARGYLLYVCGSFCCKYFKFSLQSMAANE